jgi:hypothetical protein
VTDTHPVLPVRKAPGPEVDGGRGLMLVDALAVAWGTQGRPGPGKTVWVECALPRPTQLGR